MAIAIPPRRESTLDKVAKAVGIARDILGTGASVYGAYQQKKEADLAEELQPLKKQSAEQEITKGALDINKAKAGGYTEADLLAKGFKPVSDISKLSPEEKKNLSVFPTQKIGEDNTVKLETIQYLPYDKDSSKNQLSALKDAYDIKKSGLQIDALERAKQDAFDKRNVPGLGVASSESQAQKVISLKNDVDSASANIDDLLTIAKKDFSKLSDSERTKATLISKVIRGQIKDAIVGVGAVSEYEQKVLDEVTADPGSFFSLKNRNISKLETLKQLLQRSLSNAAKNAGIKMEQKIPSLEDDKKLLLEE